MLLRNISVMRMQLVSHLICLLCIFLSTTNAIVGRDLVLTPNQGLQLHGKSIYYAEDEASKEILRNNQTPVRPWEHTLKHVTFVTLFTNAAADAAAGNISKLKEYSTFLQSPYVNREDDLLNGRFGDIVTLASGRLEVTPNGTYRFVEGLCQPLRNDDATICERERIWALWQVQKIRHRDENQKFRYEMRFSISPLRLVDENGGGGGGGQISATNNNSDVFRRRADVKAFSASPYQTFIQKEVDYPHSFGRIIYPEEQQFAERGQQQQQQQQHNRQQQMMGRNFRRQIFDASNDYTHNPYGGRSPPQHPPRYEASTLARGIWQQPPRPPASASPLLEKKLNIGEYIKASSVGGPTSPSISKATPKIEHYPSGVLNYNVRNNLITPTTFRPNYQLPRPIIYRGSSAVAPASIPPIPQEQEIIKFPSSNGGGGGGGEVDDGGAEVGDVGANANLNRPSVITHHYHHHFYNMLDANGAGGVTGVAVGPNNPESFINTGLIAYNDAIKVTSPPEPSVPAEYFQHFYRDHSTTQRQSPAPSSPSPLTGPQKFVLSQQPEIEAQQIVHVTPVPPPQQLRKPQLYQMYPITIGSNIPLLIYSTSVEDADQRQQQLPTTRRQQQEPISEATEQSTKTASVTTTTTTTITTSPPFIQSEPLTLDPIHYSEPDPLYQNVGKDSSQQQQHNDHRTITTTANIFSNTQWLGARTAGSSGAGAVPSSFLLPPSQLESPHPIIHYNTDDDDDDTHNDNNNDDDASIFQNYNSHETTPLNLGSIIVQVSPPNNQLQVSSSSESTTYVDNNSGDSGDEDNVQKQKYNGNVDKTNTNNNNYDERNEHLLETLTETPIREYNESIASVSQSTPSTPVDSSTAAAIASFSTTTTSSTSTTLNSSTFPSKNLMTVMPASSTNSKSVSSFRRRNEMTPNWRRTTTTNTPPTAATTAPAPAITTTTSLTQSISINSLNDNTIMDTASRLPSSTASPSLKSSPYLRRIHHKRHREQQQQRNIVSTSSTETPLRTVGHRQRNVYMRGGGGGGGATNNSSRATTTVNASTEKPVLKWMPRRKPLPQRDVSTSTSSSSSSTIRNKTNSTTLATTTTTKHIPRTLSLSSSLSESPIINTEENENDEDENVSTHSSNMLNLYSATDINDNKADNNAHNSILIEQKFSTNSNNNSINDSTNKSTTTPLLSQTSNLSKHSNASATEVLTQKSVSKSVSIRVGSDGEEIPVIIDDEENEVNADINKKL